LIMTGRRLPVGDAAICPLAFANAYTSDLAGGVIGSVVGGIIAGDGMQQQQQSAASLRQSLSIKLPAYSTDGNARPSQMNATPRAGLLPLSRFLVIGVGPINYAPGSEAPEAGKYEQLDVFRIPTGITEHVIRGERLPLAPGIYVAEDGK
jgi:hypothetical protein